MAWSEVPSDSWGIRLQLEAVTCWGGEGHSGGIARIIREITTSPGGGFSEISPISNSVPCVTSIVR